MKKKSSPSRQLSLLPLEETPAENADGLFTQTVREIIRVESVLSKLPMHCLSKREADPIHIQRNLPTGKVDLLWDVSPSMKYGMPGIMAYQIDTLIINKRLDEAGHPIPTLLRLGTMRSICQELGLSPSGTLNEQIRLALYQCAGAMITAKLTYTTKKGQAKRLEAGFRRYDVIFTGEQLPDGRDADAVYIVPGQVYASLLNEVPVRPLDFSYLKAIPSPSAQRWYEVASFKVYAALRNGQEQCWLDYSEYCLASGQRRYTEAVPMQKQMYKIHRPHIQSGYILDVRYETSLDQDENRDWRIWYTIGPRAVAEYQEFNRIRREPESLPDSQTLPSGASQGDLLVKHFLHLRFGSVRRDVSRKELQWADELLAQHSYETAQELIAAALARATLDNYAPHWMTGLTRYLDEVAQERRSNATAKSPKTPGNAHVGQHQPPAAEESEQQILTHAFENAYQQYRDAALEAHLQASYSPQEIAQKTEEKYRYWRQKYPHMDEEDVTKTARRSVTKELGADAVLQSFAEFQTHNARRKDEFVAAYRRLLGL
ncbi:MAG: hypothetical protein U0Y68_09000 [Blastocatellia bacterium]